MYFIDPEIVKHSRSTSPLERFDEITRKMFNSKPVYTYFKSKYSRSFWNLFRFDDLQVRFWHGICQQRTSASMDKLLNNLATRQNGIICDSIALSQGEVKQLFTPFANERFFQKSTVGALTLVSEDYQPIEKLRTITGFDDLTPFDFEESIYKRLKIK